MLGRLLPLRLREFLFGDRLGLQPLDLFKHNRATFLDIRGRAVDGHLEPALHSSRSVREAGDGDCERLVDLQPFDQPGTIAIGENEAGDVQRIEVRVLQRHGRPGEGELCRAAFHFQAGLARRGLLGFDRQHLEPFGGALERFEVRQHFLQDRVGRHIADDHEHHVLWDIPVLVEGQHLFPLDLPDHVEVPDRGVPLRMDLVDQLLHLVVHDPGAIDFAHLEFPLHNAQFPVVFGHGNQRELHVFGCEQDRSFHARCRAIDEEAGDVVRGIGVRLSAQRIEQTTNLRFCPLRGRSTGHGMFEHMAQPGPQVLALVRAARVLNVTPHRGDGRGVILLNNDRQPVGQAGEGDPLFEPLLQSDRVNDRCRRLARKRTGRRGWRFDSRLGRWLCVRWFRIGSWFSRGGFRRLRLGGSLGGRRLGDCQPPRDNNSKPSAQSENPLSTCHPSHSLDQDVIIQRGSHRAQPASAVRRLSTPHERVA